MTFLVPCQVVPWDEKCWKSLLYNLWHQDVSIHTGHHITIANSTLSLSAKEDGQKATVLMMLRHTLWSIPLITFIQAFGCRCDYLVKTHWFRGIGSWLIVCRIWETMVNVAYGIFVLEVPKCLLVWDHYGAQSWIFYWHSAVFVIIAAKYLDLMPACSYCPTLSIHP